MEIPSYTASCFEAKMKIPRMKKGTTPLKMDAAPRASQPVAAASNRLHSLGGAGIALLIFLAFTLVKGYPLIIHSHEAIAAGLGDPLLNTWILAWDVHALTTPPVTLFDANIFYPARDALAYSENMLGVLPVFAPVYWLTGSYLAAYNYSFLFCFVACGISMFSL
jgi:hypothetical protein